MTHNSAKPLPQEHQDRTSFFIEPDECVSCGVCHHEAPGRIRWRLGMEDVSEIHKPPKAREDVSLFINTIEVCCVDCIYYGGTDPEIIALIQNTLHPGAALNGPAAKKG